MDRAAWQAGYAAGLEGRSSSTPPGLDGLSFISGYIEGKAARLAGKPADALAASAKPLKAASILSEPSRSSRYQPSDFAGR
jgi:ribosome modulation factor